jgi:uncharacterized protein YyaL (SSP411 family)
MNAERRAQNVELRKRSASACLFLNSTFCALRSAFMLFVLFTLSVQGANHLTGAKSPYLLQHANDPIDWYPWSPEALAAAKSQNKPIFLSIGYSTCHWCHVMARESFSDAEIGKLLNASFIAIKVDREERPDIDSVYVAAARVFTGEAGWPLNALLTPDGKPFFAASYLLNDKLRALLERTATSWQEQRATFDATGEMVAQTLRASIAGDEPLTASVLQRGYAQLAERFDAEHGGFLPAPKFPAPHQLMFLLRYWRRSGDANALAMVETTLHAIRAGAIYDARNLGVHRYTSDAAWQEPHYEKMLYDQALLALACIEAWQATGKPFYRDTARELFTYVLRDLRAPDGTFYSAHDADVRTRRDEKILTDWNGLMIAALAAGASAFDDPAYAEAATRAARVLTKAPIRHAGGAPYLDDYAFLVWGLLNLYEATFDVRWLEQALTLERDALRRFRGPDALFYITANDAEPLLVRPRELTDGPLPSGNSVQLLNLIRLGRITADPSWQQHADALMHAASDAVSLAPSQSTALLSAVDFALGPSYEIVLAGTAIRPFQRALNTAFVPNKVVLHRPAGTAASIIAIASYTALQKPLRGKATAYVCTNYVCRLPVVDPRDMLAAIRPVLPIRDQ